MSYIDQEYFETYSSFDIPEADFTVLAERASDIIDILTMQKITRNGFENYEESVQTAIQKATAAQLETIYLNGGVYLINGGAISSGSIGKFSISQNTNGHTIKGIPVSPLIDGYLFYTGLLYGGLS